MPPESQEIFVGCLSGTLKGISLNKSFDVTNLEKYNTLNRKKVLELSWTDETEIDIMVACGTKEEQSVQIFNTETSKFTRTFKCTKGAGNIVGICNYSNDFLVAKQSGHIIRLSSNDDEEESILLNGGIDLHKMRQGRVKREIIATGGLENPLKLFDIEKRKQTFVAKNMKNDFLGLKVPIWISDMGFFSDTFKVVIASKHGDVHLYDTRAQRRPVIKVEIKSQALSSLTVHPSKMQVIVGSGKGRMNLIDLRKEGKILNSYKGSAGSITGIAINKNEDNVISIGFDRTLRIHDINTKLILKKQYLTTRLSSLLIRSELTSSHI